MEQNKTILICFDLLFASFQVLFVCKLNSKSHALEMKISSHKAHRHFVILVSIALTLSWLPMEGLFVTTLLVLVLTLR